jgi:hypothetical protein
MVDDKKQTSFSSLVTGITAKKKEQPQVAPIQAPPQPVPTPKQPEPTPKQPEPSKVEIRKCMHGNDTDKACPECMKIASKTSDVSVDSITTVDKVDEKVGSVLFGNPRGTKKKNVPLPDVPMPPTPITTKPPEIVPVVSPKEATPIVVEKPTVPPSPQPVAQVTPTAPIAQATPTPATIPPPMAPSPSPVVVPSPVEQGTTTALPEIEGPKYRHKVDHKSGRKPQPRPPNDAPAVDLITQVPLRDPLFQTGLEKATDDEIKMALDQLASQPNSSSRVRLIHRYMKKRKAKDVMQPREDEDEVGNELAQHQYSVPHLITKDHLVTVDQTERIMMDKLLLGDHVIMGTRESVIKYDKFQELLTKHNIPLNDPLVKISTSGAIRRSILEYTKEIISENGSKTIYRVELIDRRYLVLIDTYKNKEDTVPDNTSPHMVITVWTRKDKICEVRVMPYSFPDFKKDIESLSLKIAKCMDEEEKKQLIQTLQLTIIRKEEMQISFDREAQIIKDWVLQRKDFWMEHIDTRVIRDICKSALIGLHGILRRSTVWFVPMTETSRQVLFSLRNFLQDVDEFTVSKYYFENDLEIYPVYNELQLATKDWILCDVRRYIRDMGHRFIEAVKSVIGSLDDEAQSGRIIDRLYRELNFTLKTRSVYGKVFEHYILSYISTGDDISSKTELMADRIEEPTESDCKTLLGMIIEDIKPKVIESGKDKVEPNIDDKEKDSDVNNKQ